MTLRSDHNRVEVTTAWPSSSPTNAAPTHRSHKSRRAERSQRAQARRERRQWLILGGLALFVPFALVATILELVR